MTHNQAFYACDVCTKRKRKCDKDLRGCSLCVSKRLECVYSQDAKSTSANSSSTDSSRPRTTDDISRSSRSGGESSSVGTSAIEDYQTPSNPYPSVQFLDYEIFQTSQMDIPVPNIPLRPPLAEVMAPAVLREIAQFYFDTTHKWLPIVSMKRFYETLANPLATPKADVSLLVLCMKLINSYPSGLKPQSEIYVIAKQTYLEFEMNGLVTLQVLQAGILIASYEIGQAVYPSAYLSIGACARYAHMLGLNPGSRFHWKPLTWVEDEEKRRVWWGTFVLDRLVNIGCPGRPFAAESPNMDDILPSDDFLWDQGIVPRDDAPSMSSAFNIDTGRFALLIHTSHLLGRVLSHISEPNSDKQVFSQTKSQLETTLTALIYLCEEKSHCTDKRCIKDLGNISPLAICYSTLVNLYQFEMATEGEASPRLGEAISSASTRIGSLCEEFIQGSAVMPDVILAIPLNSMYAVYFAATQHVGSDSKDSIAFLALVKETLKLVSRKKWKAAGAFVQILEAREMMQADSARFKALNIDIQEVDYDDAHISAGNMEDDE